jgi:hypothetical protein
MGLLFSLPTYRVSTFSPLHSAFWLLCPRLFLCFPSLFFFPQKSRTLSLSLSLFLFLVKFQTTSASLFRPCIVFSLPNIVDCNASLSLSLSSQFSSDSSASQLLSVWTFSFFLFPLELGVDRFHPNHPYNSSHISLE